jgi:V/A-type H+-transporting ATPase subunit B
MRLGAGHGRTRADHLDIAAQVYALVARARQAADLAEVVGADVLSESERRALAFADAFETEFLIQQPDEARPLAETLDRAWRAVSLLPRQDLTMLASDELDAHYVTESPSAAPPAPR